MEGYLKKHGEGVASHTIKVAWTGDHNSIEIDFIVNKRTSRPWHSDEVFTEDWSKNWGLWNKDVVEAFLQLRSHSHDIKAPYLEIQLSPRNQPFALIITEPRKIFSAPKVLNFSHHVSLEGRCWRAHMQVTPPDELKGDVLYGGFFSCLEHDPREYFALEPNPEPHPDFHRPELFLKL
jgi:hypothetical protein